MEQTLHALGQLLLKAIPTFIILVILHFYLKWTFFNPLERRLRERWDANEGARKRARENLDKSARMAEAYEAAIRAARNGIYGEHEEHRKKWKQEQSAAIEEARREAEVLMEEASRSITSEAEAARLGLQAETDRIAEQIATTILERRTA
jgi:F-type H+-transporting ATPase subunit b